MEKSSNNLKVAIIGPYPPPYAGPEMGMILFLDSSMWDGF